MVYVTKNFSLKLGAEISKPRRNFLPRNGQFVKPTIHDRIAFLSNFHINCKLLSSFNKKLYVLEFSSWGEVPGGFGHYMPTHKYEILDYFMTPEW